MIRVVLDANVFVSGFPASAGTLPALIDRWRAGAFQLVASEPILTEVERAWTKPYWTRRFPPDRVAVVLALLRETAEITPITVGVKGVATHPEDDVVLAAAVSAAVDILVTGDRHLRAVGKYRGVTILTPREFLDRLEQQENDQS